ncbi:MAG: TonB-dependent receptor, partial [Polyangiaceae bacterium]|nr:TonB-dependent receptor [Polyangiaceae bacterium]
VGVGNLYYRNPTVRGSVIYRFTPEQDVRFTVANAYRTPLPYESTVGAYLGGAVPFQVVVPNPDLDPTIHQMMELGYRGDLFNHLRAEAVLSATRVKDPVFTRPNARIPPIDIVQGDLQHFIQGELGLTGIIRHGAEIYANFVGIHRTRDSSADTMQLRVPNRLSLGGSARFDNGFFVQGDVQMYWNFEHVRALPAARDEIPDLYEVNARVGRRVLDDQVEVFGEVWNAAGFFRDRSSLVRMYPSITPNVPIPAVALVGVALRME